VSYGLGPIGTPGTRKAILRRKAAEFLDGRFKHPAGGVAVRCDRCDGHGCKWCRQTGIRADQGEGDR